MLRAHRGACVARARVTDWRPEALARVASEARGRPGPLVPARAAPPTEAVTCSLADCHRCVAGDATHCAVCKNARLLLPDQTACVAACPAGWQAMVSGRFFGRCIARQAPAVVTQPAVAAEAAPCQLANCHECMAGVQPPRCRICKNRRYLQPDGRCGDGCATGLQAMGDGQFFRRCVDPSASDAARVPVAPAPASPALPCGAACARCDAAAGACDKCQSGALLVHGRCFRGRDEADAHAAASAPPTVEIWGVDIELADHLWMHVLRQPVHGDAHLQFGDAVFRGTHYVFRSGLAVVPHSVPQATSAVLVLDATNPVETSEVLFWLQHSTTQAVARLGLVLRADIACRHLPSWLTQYRNRFRFVFVAPAGPALPRAIQALAPPIRLRNPQVLFFGVINCN